MRISLREYLRDVKIPANLRINRQIKDYRKECRKKGCKRPYHNFAFGQSPFSPPPKIVESLRKNAHKHDYVPTAGIPDLRDNISEYYKEIFGIDCDPERIIVSPGSKMMISMIAVVLEGPLIIPTPSWVSYLPQAMIARKEVIPVRLKPEENFKLTPSRLEYLLKEHPADQHNLILNNPNNPTGAVYSKQELEELAVVLRKHNLVVISDEIYAQTAFDFDNFTSMGKVCPERTIVTGGISKDRSAGGYRFGVGIFPNDNELIKDVLKIAGSTYSSVPAPIENACITAYSMDDDIQSYIHDCTRIHEAFGTRTSALLNEIPGIQATSPAGAFYLYVDFNSFDEQIRNIGFRTCAELCEHMIEVEHTALLPGESLLLPENDFSVRLSYVDYNGDKVLSDWREEQPGTDREKADVFERSCPSIQQGIRNIERYFSQIKQGKKPEHM